LAPSTLDISFISSDAGMAIWIVVAWILISNITKFFDESGLGEVALIFVDAVAFPHYECGRCMVIHGVLEGPRS